MEQVYSTSTKMDGGSAGVGDLASAGVSNLTNPLGTWGVCGKDAAVCSAGILIGVVIMVLLLLAYYYFKVKPVAERLSLASQVYGPDAAQAAVLAGMRAGDPRTSTLARERMAPSMSALWKN